MKNRPLSLNCMFSSTKNESRTYTALRYPHTRPESGEAIGSDPVKANAKDYLADWEEISIHENNSSPVIKVMSFLSEARRRRSS